MDLITPFLQRGQKNQNRDFAKIQNFLNRAKVTKPGGLKFSKMKNFNHPIFGMRFQFIE